MPESTLKDLSILTVMFRSCFVCVARKFCLHIACRVLQCLNTSSLSNICSDIEQNSNEWKAFYTSIDSNELHLPEPYADCDAMTRLILFKCLRADRVPNVIEHIVSKNLGEALIEAHCPNLSYAYEQSNAREPIVIFTPGDDHNDNEVQEFVEKFGFADRYSRVARETKIYIYCSYLFADARRFRWVKVSIRWRQSI